MKRKCIPQEFSSSSDSSIGDDDEVNERRYNDLYQQIEELQMELHNLEIDLNKQRSTAALIKSEPRWTLQIKNGQLQLQTEIKSFEELSAYGKAFLRYLSPFGNTFKKVSFVFENTQPYVLHRAITDLTRLAIDNGTADDNMYSNSMIACYIKPEAFIDGLIDLHFHCFDVWLQAIHEHSFRKRIEKINKLEDPTTLAICASASVHICRHSFLNSQEKRYVGEYFYRKCMRKLIDMFDDPERELESLVIINIIQPFLFTTMRFNECKKWSSIAWILAESLAKKHPGYKNGNASLDMNTRILYATIHRNHLAARGILSMVDIFLNDRCECIEHVPCRFDFLPDENLLIRYSFEALNYVTQLESHPFMSRVHKRTMKTLVGEKLELTFEDIVFHDDFLIEWWHNLPEHMKISKEPYNCTKELIDSCDNVQKLTMSLYVHSVAINIYANLVNIKINGNTAQIVKDKAIYLVLYAAEIILILAKKIENLEEICFTTGKLLFRVMDALTLLLQSKDPSVTLSTRKKIEEYMIVFESVAYLDQEVVAHTSPLTLISPTSSVSIQELYKNYPLPAQALLFDVVHKTIKDVINV
ncbi:hypothetical protein RMCBS344292_16218 [Rhizopus microsporus]|nr:hypothetical protein RMCBS344292_16218 [Rhizopus microsporus]